MEAIFFWVLGCVVLLFGFLQFPGNRPLKLPPGREGWPIVRENWSFYASRHSFLHFLQPRISRYGKIFTSHLFGRRTVVSADATFNKWALQNEGKLFQANFPASFSRVLGKYGMLSIHGELQKKLHGIAVNLLAPDKIRTYFLAEVESLTRTRVRGWVGREISLQEECRKMVLELMLKQLLDVDPSEEANVIRREFAAYTSTGIGCIPIRLPGTRFYNALKARDVLVSKVRKAIIEREDHPEVVRSDLLTRLLREEARLPDEVIIDFILFLAFAGHHTSSRIMVFAVKHLTDNPSALQKLKEEHDQIRKKKNKGERLTWEDYKSMEFTQYVINETLRLNGAGMVVRQALVDIPANHHVIPKGTSVILAIDGVHKDMDNYQCPLEFNPWRWQSSDLKERTVMDAIFAPFGGGARLCPGAQLAQLEVAIFLHFLVTTCRWEEVMKDQTVQFPNPYFVHGLPIRVHPREE